MKTPLLLLCLLLLFSCKGKSPKSGTTTGTGYALTTEQQTRLASAFAYADSVSIATRSSDGFYAEFAREKDKEIRYIPVYRCDINKFYNDPTPEGLLASLSKDNLEWYVTKNEQGNVNTIRIGQGKGRWLPKGIAYDVKEGVDWLEKTYAEWKKTDFRVIHFEGLKFFTYLSDGQRIYRDNMGRTITPEELCQVLFDLLKKMKEHAERGDTLFI